MRRVDGKKFISEDAVTVTNCFKLRAVSLLPKYQCWLCLVQYIVYTADDDCVSPTEFSDLGNKGERRLDGGMKMHQEETHKLFEMIS